MRDSSIHDAFNRAVNIHNSHNILVFNNVVYNVRGGAMFTENSIETGSCQPHVESSIHCTDILTIFKHLSLLL